MAKISKLLKDPYFTIGNYCYKHCPNVLPDKWFLKVVWKQTFGYELDLRHPKTFNEKLQWLKLYDRKPEYTTMVDKYRAKQWVADRVGEEYVIPTLAVYQSVDEIDLDKLPDQFVLKCNHDSGNVVICKDKTTFDIEAAKKKLDEALKKNYYWNSREWPYKNVKRCIIAEKYLDSEENDDLTDYKMMTFNAKVKCSFTCTNRRSGQGLNVTFFDTDWERLPFERNYPADARPIAKPASYTEMVEVAERLSEHLPFSRIDFYEVKERPYFGEITLYPGAGFEPFEPKAWDATLGEWIELPERNVKLFKYHGGGVLIIFVFCISESLRRMRLLIISFTPSMESLSCSTSHQIEEKRVA